MSILNPQYIDFERHRERGRNVLSSTASQTIEIENAALGYTLFYDMNSFTSRWDRFRFGGYIFFREMIPKNAEQAQIWAKNRLEVYRGSLRHLMKSILDNRVNEEGFNLYVLKPGVKNTVRRSAIFQEDLNNIIIPYRPGGFYLPGPQRGTFKIPLKDKIEVHLTIRFSPVIVFRDIRTPVGGLEVTGGSVVINEDGVIMNPANISTSGYLSEPRISDLLPYDYKPGALRPFVPVKPIITKEYQASRLNEKIYLHTDRGYYYPKDIIWFKGYFNYTAPELMDSLSKVVLVELIDPNKKIIQSKMFPVDSGRVTGDFMLTDSVQKGTYYIRAYTRWMRNFSTKNYFLKAIQVIGAFENVRRDVVPLPESMIRKGPVSPGIRVLESPLQIISDTSVYHPRALVTVALNFKDEFDNPIAADLSVSVTDESRAVPLPDEMTIEKKMLERWDTTRVEKENKYSIERGISLSGQFKTLKRKPVKAKVKIIQGELEDMTEINTDEKGRFKVSGFNFTDSAELAFRATDEKGRNRDGKVYLDKGDAPVVPLDLPEMHLNIIQQEKKYVPALAFDLGDRIVLKEVVIKKSKLNDDDDAKSLFSTADFAVSGQKLRDTGLPSVTQAMQSMIPGFVIIGNPVAGEGRIRLGAISTFSGGTEPLITVDGVAVTDVQGPIAVLESLNFASIAKIEIFRYGGGAAYGSRAANGVIAIYTKKGKRGVNAKPGYDKDLFQLEKVKGFDIPLKFQSPQYKDAAALSNHDVDERTTLYWSPNVTISPATGEATISFYAADQPGTYRIVIEGVTTKGIPVHSEKTITIQ